MVRRIPSNDDHHSHRSRLRSRSHVEGCEDVGKVRRLERRDPSTREPGEEERHEHRKDRHSVGEEDRSPPGVEVCVDRSHLEHSSRPRVEEGGGQASAHDTREDSSRGEAEEARDDRSNRRSGHEVAIFGDSFWRLDARPEYLACS